MGAVAPGAPNAGVIMNRLALLGMTAFVLGAWVSCGGTTGDSDGSADSDAGGTSSGGAATGGSGTGGANTGGSSTGGATATGGTSTTGGASASGGAGGAGTGGSATGGNGSGGTGDCSEDCEGSGFVCCFGECVNTGNDVDHCGSCGNECEGEFPYCGFGTCGTPPCDDIGACNGNCCDVECCGADQLCCDINIGPSIRQCSDLENGTCPKGCPFCVCAAPETPIATPSGEVPIAELRLGDLVYSLEDSGVVVVPLVRVNRTAVRDHTVLAIGLGDGRTVHISPGHPDAEGRPLSELVVGQWYDGAQVMSREEIPYAGAFTYDILPASSTGAYFAAGLPVGSTLGP